MKSYVTATAALFCLAAPAFAADPTGDAEAGAKDFKRQCASCHSVADGDNVIAKGGRTGPNLFAVKGRTAGTQADYGKKYSKDMVAAGEGGLVWGETEFVAFAQNATGYLREVTGNDKARSKMTGKARSEEAATNIWAYLVSIGPEG